MDTFLPGGKRTIFHINVTILYFFFLLIYFAFANTKLSNFEIHQSISFKYAVEYKKKKKTYFYACPLPVCPFTTEKNKYFHTKHTSLASDAAYVKKKNEGYFQSMKSVDIWSSIEVFFVTTCKNRYANIKTTSIEFEFQAFKGNRWLLTPYRTFHSCKNARDNPFEI